MAQSRSTSPFGIVPTSAVFDTRLSAACLRVLMGLATYADEHRICHPSQRVLAERLGVKRQAVGRHVEELVDLGYLEKIKRFRPDGGKASNEYRIIFDQPETREEEATPMQLQIASMQTPVASHATSEVAYPCPPTVASHATSEVASLNRPIEQTKKNRPGRDATAGADGGARPSFASLPQTTAPSIPSNGQTGPLAERVAPTPLVARPPSPPPAPRVDPMWEALTRALALDAKQMTKSERSNVGGVAKQLREAGATPDDVAARVARMIEDWGPDRVTVNTVANHWSEFDPARPRTPKPKPPSPYQRSGPPRMRLASDVALR